VAQVSLIHVCLLIPYNSYLVRPCATHTMLGFLALLCTASSITPAVSETTVVSSSSTPYSHNGICRKNNCVNPIFPGLTDLPKLEAAQWQCRDSADVKPYLRFCSGAFEHDPAIASPNETAQPVDTLVKAQDDAAATMFYYHLSGMGYEGWENNDPSSVEDDCIKAVWRMVCYTYFPRKTSGCTSGDAEFYRRPCQNSCNNYIKSCNVECCDEGVQCVFESRVEMSDGTKFLQSGYVAEDGPSQHCTGAAGCVSSPMTLLLALFGFHLLGRNGGVSGSARPSSSRSFSLGRQIGQALVLSLCAFLSLTMQGCTSGDHYVANWMEETDYTQKFHFVEPGKDESTAVLNSCTTEAETKCNGRGYCAPFNLDHRRRDPLMFCVCEPGWADPECGTERKSQAKAFLLSLFLGCLGADMFYLGYPIWGVLKLLSFGGCGAWWLLDVVRTGSGPLYAADFRLANDLPFWAFAITTVLFHVSVGFLLAIFLYMQHRERKREEYNLIGVAEESRSLKDSDVEGVRYIPPGEDIHSATKPRSFRGYGAILPCSMSNAGAPFAVPAPSGQMGPPFAGPYGPSW